MAEYKGIYINRDVFQEKLAKFQADTIIEIIEFVTNPGFKKFVVTVPGYEVESTISYWEVTGGKVTLSLKECKNKELGEKLLDYIVQETQISPKLKAAIYIEKFSTKYLDDLLEYLKVYYNVIIVSTINRPNGVTYVTEGIYGDRCQLNYFSNDAFNVQGKSGLLKSQIIEGLGSFLPFSDIIEATLSEYQVEDINRSETEELFDARIPTATAYLHSVVKAILMPAVVTYRIDVESTDYSFICFPAFRVLEGFLKQILLDSSTPVINNFGEKFDGYSLLESTKNVVDCIYKETVLVKCYAYLKDNRHIHFHVDGLISSTRIIDDISVARAYIDEIMDMIEKSVRCINERDLKHLL